MKKCPKCKASMLPGAKDCPDCGWSERPKPRSKNKTHLVVRCEYSNRGIQCCYEARRNKNDRSMCYEHSQHFHSRMRCNQIVDDSHHAKNGIVKQRWQKEMISADIEKRGLVKRPGVRTADYRDRMMAAMPSGGLNLSANRGKRTASQVREVKKKIEARRAKQCTGKRNNLKKEFNERVAILESEGLEIFEAQNRALDEVLNNVSIIASVR